MGSDGRNRAFTNPFWTITGRNMPRPNKFILGAPAWLRGLVKPREGEAFVVLDWIAQEFGIAAVLSGDSNMIRAYESGDIYLWFAVKIGDAPMGATKETHGALRDHYKPAILGIQYEIQAQSLGRAAAAIHPGRGASFASSPRNFPALLAMARGRQKSRVHPRVSICHLRLAQANHRQQLQ